MLSEEQKNEVEFLVNSELDKAEKIWNDVREFILSEGTIIKKAYKIPSQIPGYPFLEDGQPKVDEFIAMVVDIRDSTNHLMCAISEKKAKVSQLQRVFYETSAVLTASAKIIDYQKGKVTEYLGDGILALFKVDQENKKSAIYSSYNAAKGSIYTLKKIVNPILKDRYSLPELSIGVGLSFSKAVITLVGLIDYMQPKVFGECVFRSTKLSKGYNEIWVDEALNYLWPKSENGSLNFEEIRVSGLKGYKIKSKFIL